MSEKTVDVREMEEWKTRVEEASAPQDPSEVFLFLESVSTTYADRFSKPFQEVCAKYAKKQLDEGLLGDDLKRVDVLYSMFRGKVSPEEDFEQGIEDSEEVYEAIEDFLEKNSEKVEAWDGLAHGDKINLIIAALSALPAKESLIGVELSTALSYLYEGPDVYKENPFEFSFEDSLPEEEEEYEEDYEDPAQEPEELPRESSDDEEDFSFKGVL